MNKSTETIKANAERIARAAAAYKRINGTSKPNATIPAYPTIPTKDPR